jgi:hypothetical protein
MPEKLVHEKPRTGEGCMQRSRAIGGILTSELIEARQFVRISNAASVAAVRMYLHQHAK